MGGGVSGIITSNARRPTLSCKKSGFKPANGLRSTPLSLILIPVLCCMLPLLLSPVNADEASESMSVETSSELCELAIAEGDMDAASRACDPKQIGILIRDESSSEPSPILHKRKNEFMRFGKRKNEFMRFGKRKNEFMRFGKRKNEFMRFGKRKNEFMRFGKRKNEFMRFGKRKNEFMRFGKRKNEFMRFGKRKNEFMRFGKRKNEFMRFG